MNQTLPTEISEEAVRSIISKYTDIHFKSYEIIQHHLNRHVYVSDQEGIKITIRLGEGSSKRWGLPTNEAKIRKHRREMFGYQMLSKLQSPRVPRVLALDTSYEILPIPYIVLTYVQGEQMKAILPTLSSQEQLRLIHRFGQIAAQFQAIPFDPAKLPEDALRYETYSEITLEHVEALRKQNRIGKSGYKRVFEVLAYYSDRLFERSQDKVFVHGDYAFRNVLVEKIQNRWEICGLIDLDMAGIGYRGYEFWDVETYDFKKIELPNARATFLNGYGDKLSREDYKLVYFNANLSEDEYNPDFIAQLESDCFSADLAWLDSIFE